MLPKVANIGHVHTGSKTLTLAEWTCKPQFKTTINYIKENKVFDKKIIIKTSHHFPP